MPSVSARLDGNRIIVPAGLVPISTHRQGDLESDPAPFTVFPMRALLDTGASRTCITNSVVQRCGLQEFTKIRIRNVRQENFHSAFVFSIGFYADALSGGIAPFVGIDLEIIGAELGDQTGFEMLVGMDVMSRCDLDLRRNGTFTFTLP